MTTNETATSADVVTADQLRRAAHSRGHTRWDLSACSMCGYMTHWQLDPDLEPVFDPGCWCLSEPRRQASWAELAAHYNMQEHPDVMTSYREFWFG